MTDIQIMNLSSGAFISLKGVSISNLNLVQDLNWDSVDVIGRMNGIKNYKNTTRKRNFDIKTDKASAVSIHTPLSEVSSINILTKFKTISERTKMLDKPTVYFTTEKLDNFLSNGQYIQRFFYPSYLEETNNYFMQSAPMFYFRMINGKLESTAYCIIRSFNFEAYFGPNKVIDTFNLKFEIEEIASSIDQVSSIIKII